MLLAGKFLAHIKLWLHAVVCSAEKYKLVNMHIHSQQLILRELSSSTQETETYVTFVLYPTQPNTAHLEFHRVLNGDSKHLANNLKE